MPVKKYRSIEEMGDTGSIDPDDPNLGRVMGEVWDFNSRLARSARSPQPRGVRKYRSIEELNRARALLTR